MKQRIALASVATLLAAAASGAHAQSTVTLYGIVGTQYVHSSTPGQKINQLANNSIAPSRLGFKGSEDLGGGNTAFFGIESGFDSVSGANSGGTTMWNRGSYVGLGSSSLGKISFGRQWNTNDDLMCGLYVCGGYASYFSLPGFGNTSNLINGAAKYTSPNIGGLTIAAMAAAKGNTGTGAYKALTGVWSGSGLTLGLSYDTQENATGQSDKLTIGGAKYEFGPAFVRASYASSKLDGSGQGKASAYDIGAGYAFTPALSATLDYVKMDKKNSPDDANFVRLVATYALSKRTSINSNLIRLSNKGNSAVGLAGATVGAGNKQNVLTFGIAHKF